MNRLDRRTYLSLAVGGLLALAGCAGEDEDADDEPTEASEESEASASEAEAASASPDEDDPDEPADDESATSAEPDGEFDVGERLEVDDFEVVVSDFDRVDDVTGADDEVLEADDGTVFGVVDLAVRHAGEEAILAVDEYVSVDLGDEEGGTYDRIDALENDPQVPTESRLAPGEVARGTLVYELDDDTDAPVVDLESVDGEAYVVTLDEEADSSVTLEQELDDVRSFGQHAEGAGVEVTVTTLEHGNNLGGFMQSDEGHEVVAVGLSLENESGRDRTLSTGQAALIDEFGRHHGDAPKMVRGLEDFEGTELKGGEEHDGKIAYQIEEGHSELYWVFDFLEWGDDRREFWKLR